MNNEKINVFIEPIFAKKSKHDFFAWLKLRKLIKTIHKTAPSYDTLMQINELLYILKDVYMYNNNKELAICTIPKNYIASFAFNNLDKDNEFSIAILLGYDNCIAIQTKKNMKGGKADIWNIQFKDGEASINSTYDEERFKFIEACIMNGLINIIKYYYDNKIF